MRGPLKRSSSLVCLSLVAILVVPSAYGLASQDSLKPETYTTSDWKNWATTAWAYYAPGVGVNPTTGLHQANLAWPCFTGWDVAAYIFSIIYARKLGLITDNGGWQFNDRIQKVLTFLENRPLLPGTTTPFWAYRSDAINPYQSCPGFDSNPTDAADSGLLLGALDALRTFDSAYSTQVNTIFTLSKLTYAQFASVCNGPSYYGYLYCEGYRAFGYNAPVFSDVDNYAGGYVPVYGQSLPEIKTLSEPLVLEILTEHPSATFLDFANRAYLAQMGRWNGGSGPLTAWSEGAYAPSPNYIYEWILVKNQTTGTWQTWILADAGASTIYNVQPIAYTKVAFSYLAIYGENSYTLALVNAAKQLASSQGFGEGTFENGASAIGLWGSNTGGFYSDKTNEIILAAAAHVVSSTSTSVPLSTIQSLVEVAPSDSVYVVLPDYTGTNYPSHTPATKCGGVVDGLATDIFAGSYVLGSLAHPQYEVLDTSQYVSQSSQTCGQPLMSSTQYPVILAFASFYVNELVEYYDSTWQTPVYLSTDPTLQYTIIQRSTGNILASETAAQRDSGVVDYFVIQAFKDTDGRSVFNLWGIGWTGTYAVTVYFVTNILPNISTFTDGWYLYQWNDASSGPSHNSIPDAGDTFTLISSGN